MKILSIIPISTKAAKEVDIKTLLCIVLTLFLLPVAAFSQEVRMSEESTYIIRVTSANEGLHPVVKVLELEVNGEDARQFTRKATPFEFEIEAQDFEALFKAPSEGRIEVEFLVEGTNGEENFRMRAISSRYIHLSHHPGFGGQIRAGAIMNNSSK